MTKKQTLLAVLLFVTAQVVVAGTQNWRVLSHRETITLLRGNPVSFPAGTAVCGFGLVPASYDPVRKSFRTAGCPPMVIHSNGFESLPVAVAGSGGGDGPEKTVAGRSDPDAKRAAEDWTPYRRNRIEHGGR